jgi:hypothetical protein
MTTTPEVPAAAPVAAPAAAAAPVAAEPVAAAPVAAEPVAAAPQIEMPAPPPAPEFPSADGYDWSTFEGSFDGFDERLSPWMQGLHGHLTEGHNAELEASSRQTREWQELYNAVVLGDEDPRLAQLNESIGAKDTYAKSLEERIRAFEAADVERQEAEDNVYFEKLQADYGERFAANPQFVDASMPLVDAGFMPHEAFELAAIGQVDVAAKLIEQVNDSSIVHELLMSRQPKTAAPAPAPVAAPKPQPRKAAGVVTGTDVVESLPEAKPKPLPSWEANPQAATRAALKRALARSK